MIKEMKCPNCGGPITHLGWGKYHCEYCGTEFENKDEYGVIHVIGETPDTVKLVARTQIDSYYLLPNRKYNRDIIYEEIKKDLCDQLSKALMEHIKISENWDFKDMKTNFVGIVKIMDN